MKSGNWIEMKNRIYIFRIIVIILFFIPSSQLFAQEIFTIVDSMDAPPFKSANSEGKPSGVFYDIINSAFGRMGVPFKYEGYPWKRAQMLVKMKKADALITVPTPERLEYLISNREAIFIAKNKLFTQRDNPNIAQIKSVESLSDLKGLKIIGFSGSGWGKKMLKQFEVDWLPNIPSMCKALAAYRGDVILENEIVILHTIKNIKNNERNWGLTFDHLISFDAPVPPMSFHLLIHKESKFLHLLPKFDETIRAMREDGELDRIIGKWTK